MVGWTLRGSSHASWLLSKWGCGPHIWTSLNYLHAYFQFIHQLRFVGWSSNHIWSEKLMSPGKEEPTAGADVFAAQRGTVGCSWARLLFLAETSHFSCLDSWTRLNQQFVGNIRNFAGLNRHSDRSKPLCFGGKLRNLDDFISDWPRWPLQSGSEKLFRLTRN